MPVDVNPVLQEHSWGYRQKHDLGLHCKDFSLKLSTWKVISINTLSCTKPREVRARRQRSVLCSTSHRIRVVLLVSPRPTTSSRAAAITCFISAADFGLPPHLLCAGDFPGRNLYTCTAQSMCDEPGAAGKRWSYCKCAINLALGGCFGLNCECVNQPCGTLMANPKLPGSVWLGVCACTDDMDKSFGNALPSQTTSSWRKGTRLGGFLQGKWLPSSHRGHFGLCLRLVVSYSENCGARPYDSRKESFACFNKLAGNLLF